MVQPFHAAFAAENILSEPEPTQSIAEPVKEQVEETTPIEIEEQSETLNKDVESIEDTEPVIETENFSEPPANESVAESTESINQNSVASSSSVSFGYMQVSSTSQTQTDSSTNEEGEQSSTTSAIGTSTNTEAFSGSNNSSSGDSDSESEYFEQSSTSTATSTQQEDGVTLEEPDTEEFVLDELNINTPQVEIATTTSASKEATTSDQILIKDTIQAEILISDENFYQFSKQSCVAVGDGTYHCSSSDIVDYDLQSVVYSDLGQNGNMEIYLKTSKGDIKQVTDNEYDDTAPYYDAETLQVVWQRSIDDRFQIILYDIVKDKESQLTFSRTNNMEPKVSADGVVWQAWDNNDWEIMYFDGTATDQITDNLLQDVTPVIQDGYILWTVIGRSEQEAKVYSLDSGEILTIEGHDGGSIANPRFVLVYDTKFANGDIITKGFDPATGISEQISAKAAPEPIEIPATDTIGEIRALIQNKSSFEDDHDLEKASTADGQSGNTSTSTTNDTLNLKDLNKSTSTIAITATSTDEVLELTEFDLILTEPVLNAENTEEGETVPVLDATSAATSTQ